MQRRARDLQLLDALDALAPVLFEGPVWRIVRQGRDPAQGYPAGGRWDPGQFEVLYTALAREGAMAEIHFHLSRQPVFPSRLVSILHRLSARTKRSLKLADMAALEPLGIDTARFGELDYRRSQEIGDAAFFLGFDGMIVPSARWACQNLVLFTERLEEATVSVETSDVVDWLAWREEVARLRERC